MKRLMIAGLSLSVWAIAPSSFAQTITKESPQATINLYRGQGVTLNFRPTGDTVQKAWLDDPSRTTLDFDDASCAATATESCAASVIHLRRINPLDFSGLPTANSTSLTVLTDNNLYSFQIAFPESGSPSYSVLNIQPESENVPTIPSRPQVAKSRQSGGIAAIEQGLDIALDRQLISIDDPLWQRTQRFLSLVKDGVSAQSAAQQAGVSRDLILRLAEIGEQSQNSSI